MPITVSERALTDEERAKLREFRERPSCPRWWVNALVVIMAIVVSCGGVLTGVVYAVADALVRQPSIGRIVSVVLPVVGGVSLVVAWRWWRSDVIDRRRRRINREAVALGGVVDVHEVTFTRAWRVKRPQYEGLEPGVLERQRLSDAYMGGPHIVAEILPNLIAELPAPEDEDEHGRQAAELARLHSLAIVTGTMPRDRVLVEWARVPGRAQNSILLSIRWVGAPMTPIDDGVDSGLVHAPQGLGAFAETVAMLACGPWANSGAEPQRASETRPSPVRVTERPMTDKETNERISRESPPPRTPITPLVFLAVLFIIIICWSDGSSVRENMNTASFVGWILVVAFGTIGMAIAVWHSVRERRSARTPLEGSSSVPEAPEIVRVYEVAIQRAWRVSEVDAALGTNALVVLEIAPNCLVQVWTPDAGIRPDFSAASLQAGTDCARASMFTETPLDHLRIEWRISPDGTYTTTTAWHGEALVYEGEVSFEQVSFRGMMDLCQLSSSRIAGLVRGPWTATNA